MSSLESCEAATTRVAEKSVCVLHGISFGFMLDHTLSCVFSFVFSCVLSCNKVVNIKVVSGNSLPYIIKLNCCVTVRNDVCM